MSPIVQTGMSATDVLPSKIRRLTAGTCLVWHRELTAPRRAASEHAKEKTVGVECGLRTGLGLVFLCSVFVPRCPWGFNTAFCLQLNSIQSNPTMSGCVMTLTSGKAASVCIKKTRFSYTESFSGAAGPSSQGLLVHDVCA